MDRSSRSGAAFAALVLVLLFLPSAARAADGLDWGLKESWRNYIGLKGTTLSNGATRNEDGTFHFPLVSASFDEATRDTKVQFRGTVQFLGHCDGADAYTRPCALDMTMADPRVEITEDGAFVYARMTSRPIEGGEIVDHPHIKVAELDVEAAQPAVADGRTTWSALPTTMAPEGAAVFTYPTGTVIDPVTFSYEGPGGKPLGEIWTVPGSVRYLSQKLAANEPARTIVWTVPGRNADEVVGIYGHDGGGIVLLDATTYEPKAGTHKQTYLEPHTLAFDQATATGFYGEAGANVGLTAIHWNGTEWVSAPVPGSVVARQNGQDMGGSVWDAFGQRYLLIRVVGGVQQLWQVKKVDGAWAAANLGPVRGGNRLPVPTLVDLELAPGGRGAAPYILAADEAGGIVRRLHVVENEVIAEPLPQADGATATRLVATTGGVYAIGYSTVRYMSVQFRSLMPAGPPVEVDGAGGNGAFIRSWVASDAARSRLFLLSTDLRSVLRFDAGTLTHSFEAPVEGGMRYWTDFFPGTTKDGRLVHSVLSQETNPGTYGLAYASQAPRFTTQPASVAAVAGASVTYSVAVTGDPAPTVRWQTRVPGQGGWVEVDGATGTALTVSATVADHGRQYRAIAANTGGELASERTTLEVRTAPTVSVQPDDVTAIEDDDTLIKVMPLGQPTPAVTWQQRIGGFWRAVDAGSGDFDVDGGFLTVKGVNRAMSGTQFRAQLTNAAGTLYTRTVTLTVAPRLTAPASFGGGHVDWGFSNRWRCYVVGNVARGGIEPSGGAAQLPGTLASGSLCAGRDAGSESVRFPVRGGSYDPTTRRLELRLGGAVRFWGHAHHGPPNLPLLDTRFTNLRLVAEGNAGTLYADAVGATMTNPVPVTRTGVALARVELGGAAPRANGLDWVNVPASLTAEGAPVFGDYPAGEPLDALTLAPDFGTPQPDSVEPVPTTAPVAIVPAPVPTPAPTVTAAPRSAFSVPTKPQRVAARTRVAKLATLRCVSSRACAVTAPARVAVRVGGKRYTATVLAPKSVKAGRTATVRVRFSKAGLERLRGRRAVVSVRVGVRVDGVVTRRVVKVTVRR